MARFVTENPLRFGHREQAAGQVGLEVLLSCVLACLFASLGVLLFDWTFGSDPATGILREPPQLRDELRPVRKVPVGELVLLNDSSVYRWTLGPGFASSEKDGTWVRSRGAQIVFYPEDVPLGYEDKLVLEISVSPLLVGDREVRSLRVDSGLEQVEVDLGVGGGRVEVALPEAEEQIVELFCDSLDSPADDLGVSDLRRLCVKVYAMAVRVDPKGATR